ncbi:hypothetical protein Tco_1216456 [Tanacetum coccineum]
MQIPLEAVTPSITCAKGIPGNLSLGIGFPGYLSPGIGRAEKLEGDTFPGDLPGRHRGAHTVSVKQIFATVEGFLGRHVARDTKFIKRVINIEV